MNDLWSLFGAMSLRRDSPDLRTSDVSLISHTHGRERRAERGIERRELQEAIKYGRRERANPGRNGRPRWRFVHKGVVYITDETGRHEVTSWRLEDTPEPPPPGCVNDGRAHVVVVVDASGSMRKGDVPGYESRTAAVYDCLARELVEPQRKVGGATMEVTLIEMRDCAEVLMDRAALDEQLTSYLHKCAHTRASSHGNYVPALEEALSVMQADAARTSQLVLLFLSDGAPSDHTLRTCPHGTAVWQHDGWSRNGRPKLRNCPYANNCRAVVRQQVLDDCVAMVRRMGDLLGRDRVFVHTVAFGPPDEDYAVLQAMAAALPRSSFQKLGLSADCLRTALSTLSSTLTTLRTDAGGGRGLTLRAVTSAERGERQVYEERDLVRDGHGWDVYVGDLFIRRQRYCVDGQRMVVAPLEDTEMVARLRTIYPLLQRGIAHAQRKLGEGAERVVHQCTEVVSTDGGRTAIAIGRKLVAKSSRYLEHLSKDDFHKAFCRTQAEAEGLAQMFNRRLAMSAAWQVRFLPCWVYTIVDEYYSESPRGLFDILVEEELDAGRFTKWNNNAGGVASTASRRPTAAPPARQSGLGAIFEDDEDEEGDEYGSSGDEAESGYTGGARPEEVPQAFSHFSWVATAGRKLVCDLQGVYNTTDGFVLTDPVIHHSGRSGRKRATDKGDEGIQKFFQTHVCNPLCKRLGLHPGPTA